MIDWAYLRPAIATGFFFYFTAFDVSINLGMLRDFLQIYQKCFQNNLPTLTLHSSHSEQFNCSAEISLSGYSSITSDTEICQINEWQFDSGESWFLGRDAFFLEAHTLDEVPGTCQGLEICQRL